MSVEEGRKAAERVVVRLGARREELASTDEPVKRARTWSAVAEDYLELIRIAARHTVEAVVGVEGVPLPVAVHGPFGRLALALAGAELASWSGTVRVPGTFSALEAHEEARRLLDGVAAGGMSGRDVVETHDQLLQIVRGLDTRGQHKSVAVEFARSATPGEVE